MKKFLALVLILGMAQVASAGFLISVDGVVDPPDTSIELFPSETAIIDIHTDGTVPNPQDVWLVASGPGMLQSGGALNPAVAWAAVAESTLQDAAMVAQFQEFLGDPTITSIVMSVFVLDAPGNLPAGMLVDEILFHCEEVGEVLLTLWKGDFSEVYDTQIIHQIPEPMTMALLGLGGLALIRRRK